MMDEVEEEDVVLAVGELVAAYRRGCRSCAGGGRGGPRAISEHTKFVHISLRSIFFFCDVTLYTDIRAQNLLRKKKIRKNEA